MKIRPVGAELFHANGWTDITKVIVAFRNFVNAPKNRVPTLQTMHCISDAKANQLMLFREVIAVNCENHSKCVNTHQWNRGLEC